VLTVSAFFSGVKGKRKQYDRAMDEGRDRVLGMIAGILVTPQIRTADTFRLHEHSTDGITDRSGGSMGRADNAEG
jgi:hypothetical protein